MHLKMSSANKKKNIFNALVELLNKATPENDSYVTIEDTQYDLPAFDSYLSYME